MLIERDKVICWPATLILEPVVDMSYGQGRC